MASWTSQVCKVSLLRLLLLAMATVAVSARVVHDGPRGARAGSGGWQAASVVAFGDITSPAGKDFSAVLHPSWEPLGSSVSGGTVVANGNYSDATRHPSFFGQLRVESLGSAGDALQSYAAGFLEGALTAERISQHYGNLESWWSGQGEEVLANVTAWLAQQDAFASALVDTASEERRVDSVPARLRVVMRQLDGLSAGYAAAVANSTVALRKLGRRELHLLNSVGDMLDLFAKARSPIPWAGMAPHEVVSAIATAGHCSALVKVTPDLSDILLAHSSWFIYGSMLRIYKHYTLNVAVGAMRTSSFSSYPGVLSSLDDFYLHDTGLVLLQTTNSVFNATLYEEVRPGSLLAWQRVRIANMAASGTEWVQAFSPFNSGTYNNQYMVVDLKRFQRGKALLDGLLTVVEQMPGVDGVISADMTQILVLGYWPSFNVPFFDRVYRNSGYPEVVENLASRGPEFAAAAEGLSYQAAPRSKIFRRDSGTVIDLQSLKHLMRYNGFPNDPLSGGSPFGAICSRGDLSKDKPSPVGCYDSKVTNYDMAWRLEAEAVNGPTTQDGLPPFSWQPFTKMAHEGQPDVWDFDFELQSPRDNTSAVSPASRLKPASIQLY